MKNNNTAFVRVALSGLIGLVSIAGAIYLLSKGVTIPPYYWGIAGLAIAGVVGVDVAQAIYTRIKR